MTIDKRKIRGAVAYHSGVAAEVIVEREYLRRGATICNRRYRGSAGEIDLITRQDDDLVFVEIKKARDVSAAAARLGAAQIRRICATAAEFLAGEPLGELTPVRFDVALVDATGTVEIIENAFGDV